VNIVRGIVAECFVTYVSRRFHDVKEVRDLVASNEVNDKLLEAVSDRIELGVADVVAMFASQSRVQAQEGSDECNAPHCFVGLASKYFVGKECISSGCFVGCGQIHAGSYSASD
jgi:hypothetical protein